MYRVPSGSMNGTSAIPGGPSRPASRSGRGSPVRRGVEGTGRLVPVDRSGPPVHGDGSPLPGLPPAQPPACPVPRVPVRRLCLPVSWSGPGRPSGEGFNQPGGCELLARRDGARRSVWDQPRSAATSRTACGGLPSGLQRVAVPVPSDATPARQAAGGGQPFPGAGVPAGEDAGEHVQVNPRRSGSAHASPGPASVPV